MKFEPYSRRAYYYETDRMDIVHHSNYIRWLEEARLDLIEKMGCKFADVEKQGLMVPVMSVECKYEYPVKYDDLFEVRCTLTSFSGCKFELAYEVFNLTTGKRSAEGKSSHCFTNAKLMPKNIKKSHPEIYTAFKNAVEE